MKNPDLKNAIRLSGRKIWKLNRIISLRDLNGSTVYLDDKVVGTVFRINKDKWNPANNAVYFSPVDDGFEFIQDEWDNGRLSMKIVIGESPKFYLYHIEEDKK